MAKILKEGCVVTCEHCRTVFSFTPSEVGASFREVPAGYSPEEEAYEQTSFYIQCPKCQNSVCVNNALGEAGKKSIAARAREALKYEDYDL